jgi:prepilin-type N-terminal cleavage/methylation domain-containing protein
VKTTTRRSSRGFTLIELLAAMVVLIIIVGASAQLFANASTAWRLGMKKTDGNVAARVALEMMSRELGGALVDDKVHMGLEEGRDQNFGKVEWTSDRIHFVSLTQPPLAVGGGSPGYRRDVRQVAYFVTPIPGDSDRLRLSRHCREYSPQNYEGFVAYHELAWWTSSRWTPTPELSDTLVENVRRLRFKVMDAMGNELSASDLVSTNRPISPAFVDIYLEILGKPDAKRSVQMPVEDLEKVTMRYADRVYLQNVRGYARDN